MNPVQLLLVAAILVFVLLALKSRQSQRTQAAKKLLFVGFALCSTLAVIFPDLVQGAAELVGVGRGTDLLLYLAIVLLLYAGLDIYMRFQDLEDSLTKLTRRMALLESESSVDPAAGGQHHASDPVRDEGQQTQI